MYGMLKERTEPQVARGEAEEDEPWITLLDILIILARGKWIWLGSAALCGVIALGVGYLLPMEFRAETDILAPAQSVSTSSLLMGQVGNLLGMSGGLGGRDQNEVILSILRSRTVGDALVKQFNLTAVYKRPDTVLAAIELARRTSIFTTIHGSIAVIVEDRDPKRAAVLANAYVEQLYKQNERFAFSEAAQRRMFFQHQIEQEKNNLEDAEVALKETELKTGVIELQGQTALALRTVADLRAQITSGHVQLQTLLTSETPNNPDVVRLREQIRALEANLARVQSAQSKSDETNGVSLSTSAVPTLALDYVRKLREVKYHEELFSLLTRQLEAAKIDESKDAPALQVIDAAVPPHFPSSPRRLLITAVGIALGLVLGWLYTVAAAMARLSMNDPQNAAKWWNLRRAILS